MSMNCVTPVGHWAFGILWTLAMLVIIVGFAGVGSLPFAPWLLLLVPFAAVRVGFQRGAGIRSTLSGNALRAANFIVEAAMFAIFVYVYNLSVLTYCPAPK